VSPSGALFPAWKWRARLPRVAFSLHACLSRDFSWERRAGSVGSDGRKGFALARRRHRRLDRTRTLDEEEEKGSLSGKWSASCAVASWLEVVKPVSNGSSPRQKFRRQPITGETKSRIEEGPFFHSHGEEKREETLHPSLPFFASPSFQFLSHPEAASALPLIALHARPVLTQARSRPTSPLGAWGVFQRPPF